MIRVAELCKLITDWLGRHDERVRNRLVQRTTLSHVLTPTHQNSTMAKDELVRLENVLGKYNLLNDVARWCSCSGVTRGCAPRIRLRPPRCDEVSGVLIGADGTRRSDWLERVQAVGVRARSDR